MSMMKGSNPIDPRTATVCPEDWIYRPDVGEIRRDFYKFSEDVRNSEVGRSLFVTSMLYDLDSVLRYTQALEREIAKGEPTVLQDKYYDP